MKKIINAIKNMREETRLTIGFAIATVIIIAVVLIVVLNCGTSSNDMTSEWVANPANPASPVNHILPRI